MNTTKQLLLLIIPLLLFGCRAEKGEENESSTNHYVEERSAVKIVKAKRGVFFKEVLNNGKLQAQKSARILFKQKGEIVNLFIENGEKVTKGELMAILDNSEQNHAYQEALRNYEKSELNLQDALISAGYSQEDSLLIPPSAYKIAAIKSGYYSAKENLVMKKKYLSETKIYAPFSGVVSGMEAKIYNQSSNYKELCTLIDPSVFEVVFPILESELSLIKKGLDIELSSYVYPETLFPGIISSINPIVEKTGMFYAKATIPNNNSLLMAGMNVQVKVKIEIPNQIVIPKQAVVLRQERKVVFTYYNDTAYWHYVTVGEENSDMACIRSGLKPGAKVITEGNFELAHLSPVQLEE